MFCGETVIVNGSEVENVLVEPILGDSAETASGATVNYNLRFPAEYPGAIYNAVIVVRGNICKTVGYADHYRPVEVFGPAWVVPWDMTVKVEGLAGAMTEQVDIVALNVTRDSEGLPVKAERVIWSGLCKAYMTDGEESENMPLNSDGVENWLFTCEYDETIAGLSPTGTVIRYKDSVFNVQAIRDIGNIHSYIELKAIRHV